MKKVVKCVMVMVAFMKMNTKLLEMVVTLRCLIGWHEWSHFRMSCEYQKAFPEKSHWGRECVRCDKLQYLSDDKIVWQNGVRGILKKYE